MKKSNFSKCKHILEHRRPANEYKQDFKFSKQLSEIISVPPSRIIRHGVTFLALMLISTVLLLSRFLKYPRVLNVPVEIISFHKIGFDALANDNKPLEILSNPTKSFTRRDSVESGYICTININRDFYPNLKKNQVVKLILNGYSNDGKKIFNGKIRALQYALNNENFVAIIDLGMSHVEPLANQPLSKRAYEVNLEVKLKDISLLSLLTESFKNKTLQMFEKK